MYTWTCTQNPIIDIELTAWALPLLIVMERLRPFQDMIFVKLICVNQKIWTWKFPTKMHKFQLLELARKIKKSEIDEESCQISTLSSFFFLALVFPADPPFPRQDLMCSLSCAIIAFLAFSDQTLASESTCDVENIWSRRLVWGRSSSETLPTCWVVEREKEHTLKGKAVLKVDLGPHDKIRCHLLIVTQLIVVKLCPKGVSEFVAQ